MIINPSNSSNTMRMRTRKSIQNRQTLINSRQNNSKENSRISSKNTNNSKMEQRKKMKDTRKSRRANKYSSSLMMTLIKCLIISTKQTVKISRNSKKKTFNNRNSLSPRRKIRKRNRLNNNRRDRKNSIMILLYSKNKKASNPKQQTRTFKILLKNSKSKNHSTVFSINYLMETCF